MTNLDVEQEKAWDELRQRHLSALEELSRSHMERAKRKLMAIPDDVWDEAMANDMANDAAEEADTDETTE